MTIKEEVFISVDIETAGPIVGEHSMLSLAACLVYSPSVSFSIMLQPISEMAIPEALEICGLTLEDAHKNGASPGDAMAKFARWILDSIPADATPVFVGLNAPFDWSFVNYYFLKYFNSNPFGFTALDIKALFMGATGCSWRETKSSNIDKIVHSALRGDHDALHDAVYQAELFRLVYAKARKGE
jgi:DNA polymerase III epsilon subunit-like protein